MSKFPLRHPNMPFNFAEAVVIFPVERQIISFGSAGMPNEGKAPFVSYEVCFCV